ncbi:MAG TPA: hypothetical protein VK569_00885 [Bacteroidota bacterium]|nr:hypothetical protein [Bacteroidota bacterium]
MTTTARRLVSLTLFLSMAGAALGFSPIDPRGKPANTEAGKVEHYAVWKDEDGWHVRTTTKEYEHHFRGVIDVRGGEFEKVKGYKLEHKGAQKDLFIEGPEHHQITFDFSTKGSIDGVDFHVKGNEPMLSFTLMIGEKDPKFEPARVFIGKAGVHPSETPFQIPAHGK